MKREFHLKVELPRKLEFRDVLAVLALLVLVYAMNLEAAKHPIAEWLKGPLATILTVVLGYYFVDSARRAQASATVAPPAAPAPQPPAAPAEPAPAAPEGQ